MLDAGCSVRKIAQPPSAPLTSPATVSLTGFAPYVNSTPAAPAVAQTIFDHATVTLSGAFDAGVGTTLGVVFNSTVQGEIREVYFYKPAANVDNARSVGLYSTAGALLRGGASSGEAAGPGWVKVTLDSPYTIDADVMYVAAVHFPTGRYPVQAGAFASPVTRGDLLAESDSGAPVGNGRYNVGASLAYPNNGGSQSSYGVDVGFFPDPFPTADSTGASGSLTPMSGAVHLLTDGQVLENAELSGWVVVHALNCVIRNCRITNPDGGVVGCIRVDTNDSTGAGLLVENCTIDGGGITTNGIMAEGTFIGNRIVGCDNGINVYGPSIIRENYIVCDVSDGVDPHFDGIEMNAGSNIVIRHNTVLILQGQTSAVMMNNEFGPLQDIDIIDNYLSGGGYTIYCDNGKSASPVDAASIRIKYNKLGSGIFGYYALYTSGVTPTGNYDAVTGNPA